MEAMSTQLCAETGTGDSDIYAFFLRSITRSAYAPGPPPRLVIMEWKLGKNGAFTGLVCFDALSTTNLVSSIHFRLIGQRAKCPNRNFQYPMRTEARQVKPRHCEVRLKSLNNMWERRKKNNKLKQNKQCYNCFLLPFVVVSLVRRETIFALHSPSAGHRPDLQALEEFYNDRNTDSGCMYCLVPETDPLTGVSRSRFIACFPPRCCVIVAAYGALW